MNFIIYEENPFGEADLSAPPDDEASGTSHPIDDGSLSAITDLANHPRRRDASLKGEAKTKSLFKRSGREK